MSILSKKNQFRLGSGVIIMLAGIAVALLVYKSLQNQLLNTVHRRTQIYLNMAGAIRTYIKDSLRPEIYKEVGNDRFIVEAMSTSYISRQIMKNLKNEIPEFQYKRAASNPRNEINQADDFEMKMIEWFNNNKDKKRWGGSITKDKKLFYAELMPIVVEDDCLFCHGDPKDAPKEMTDVYGKMASFGYQLGDVVATDTIYIPLAYSNTQIKEKAWLVFIIGVALLFMLIVTITILFNQTVVSQLSGTITRFKALFDSSDKPFPIDFNKMGDEIEQVQDAFEQTADQIVIMHDELLNSEKKYRQLFESSPNTIFICDANCNLLELNSTGYRVFEIDEQNNLSSLSLFDFFQQAKDKEKVLSLILHKREHIDLDLQMVTYKGRNIDVFFSAKPVFDEHDQMIGFEGVIRDITQRKQMDKYLAQTEKLASIGQLAAGIAHEINNPLGVIKCYSDLIRKNPEINSQVAEDIDVIQKHTQNCKSIVESLLKFARVSEPKFEDSNLHECINEILSVLQAQMSKQNIEVEKNYNGQISTVALDESKFKQVLMNLLMNGIHAMPEGGRFTIKTGFIENQDKIYIDVCDTGTGIPLEFGDRIFEPFFTTKTAGKGTGLGLSVSYGIIQQHNGDIKVFNNKYGGATFSIQIPVFKQGCHSTSIS